MCRQGTQGARTSGTPEAHDRQRGDILTADRAWNPVGWFMLHRRKRPELKGRHRMNIV